MPPSIQRPPLPRTARIKKSAAVAAMAVTLVGGLEGLRRVAYLDPPGIATICYGETRGVKLGDVATDEQCKKMLINSLSEFSLAIDKCLPPSLADNAYVAFLSASYNIGPEAFCSSSMARHANAGNLTAACDSLLLWDKVTIAGVKTRLPGLARRRQEERNLCLTGVSSGA